MTAMKPCSQVVQVLAGGHGARTYQDERFSYVVMRRGQRPGPESIPDLTVARQRQVDPPDAVQHAIEAGEESPFSPFLLRFLCPAPTLCPPLAPLQAHFPDPSHVGPNSKEGWICHESFSVASSASVFVDPDIQ